MRANANSDTRILALEHVKHGIMKHFEQMISAENWQEDDTERSRTIKMSEALSIHDDNFIQ